MIARWPLNSEPKEKFDPHVWGALPVPVLRYHEETKALFLTNLGLSVTTCKRNPTCTLPRENRSKALRQPMAKQGTLGQNKVHHPARETMCSDIGHSFELVWPTGQFVR